MRARDSPRLYPNGEAGRRDRRVRWPVVRRLALAGVALAFAFLAGAARAGAPSRTLYLSPTGSDSHPCTRAAPCASFGRAYAAARPGDTVLVACGGARRCAYPTQTIPYPLAKRGRAPCRAAETFPDGQTTNDDASGCITFRPQRGVRPKIASVAIEVPYVGLDGLTVTGTIFAGANVGRVDQPCSAWNVHDLILRDLTATGFDLDSVSYVYVLGGTYGPLLNDASKVEPCRNGDGTGGGHVALDGVTMHDYRQTEAGTHMECIHFQQGADSLIVRSRFLNCAQQDLSVQTQSGSRIDGLLIANDVFDAACSHAASGDHCGVVSGGTTTFICNDPGDTLERVTMLDDTLNGTPSFQRTGSCAMRDITVRGSVVTGPQSQSACAQERAVGVRYVYDAFTNARGPACGPGNVLGASRGSTWVDPARYDYRLARGSRALELVPRSRESPAYDIAGALRPLRGRADAGAYQRESALVVPGRSIGAASIGERRAAVVAFYGRPQHTLSRRSHGRVESELDYRIHGGVLSLTIESGAVVGLATTSRYYATAAGLGPGASATVPRAPARRAWKRCGGALRKRFGRTIVALELARGSNRLSEISITRAGAGPGCR